MLLLILLYSLSGEISIFFGSKRYNCTAKARAPPKLATINRAKA